MLAFGSLSACDHWGPSAFRTRSTWSRGNIISQHDDVIKWNHFPRYWPFVWGIHRSPVNSPHKGQWHGALMFSLICAWINDWVNNREAGDLRPHRAHYDVTIMITCLVNSSARQSVAYFLEEINPRLSEPPMNFCGFWLDLSNVCGLVATPISHLTQMETGDKSTMQAGQT